MSTYLRLLLFAVAFTAGAGLRAEEPATGKVLILDNERTLEGEIERIGDVYHVRRAIGTTTISAERARKLCASKQEALDYLRGRANLEDPDEHLRLARWCHIEGLRDEAVKLVKSSLALRPEHAESKRLLNYLEQWANQDNAPPPAAPAATARAEAPPGPPPVSISADAMAVFSTRIQPILMNTCARCHASADHGTAFRLQRTHGIGLADRRAVQVNLSAVLAQLHTGQVERSPLLIKAISAHGPSGQAPLKGREAVPYRLLEDWVRVTLATNPHLHDAIQPPPALLTASASTPEKPAPKPAPPVTPVVDPAPAADMAPTTPEVRTVPISASPTPAEEQPAEESVEPESEVDPLIFNREVHPQGKPKSPPENSPE